MKNNRAIFIIISLLFSVTRLLAQDWQTLCKNPAYLHRAIKQVTDVMVHDVYSPPVASRTYAYISVAGYEAARFSTPEFLTLAGQLRDLKSLPQPDAAKQYCYTLSAVNAILIVGKAMVISEDKIGEFNSTLLQEFKQLGVPQEVFDSSVAFGKQVAEHILAWSGGDNYKISRGYPKYAVKNDAATWKPTPPSYMKAVEPYWNKIRPFCIDSAAQFKPKPATPFSIDKKSRFYKEAIQVRDARVNLTQEQSDIANFWDCNPFKINISGHVMFASKKISPGGHWENITRLACEKTNASFIESAEAYVRLSVTIHDAFISCWDEKFRSKVIRPETYINQHIDANWLPLLQTPPFPEYTSGHSVLSAASAVILGKLFGENFAYADSTEVEFKIPVRHFKSFKQAANEAAISRLYGGIHYMPSIKNGMEEGNKLGIYVNSKIVTRKLAQTSALNNSKK